MIDGVTILAAETVEIAHPILDIVGELCIPAVFIGLILCVVGFSVDSITSGFTGLGIVILSFIIGTASAIAGLYITVPAYQKYEVILDDSISMNEFTNTYEVLEQRGQIYVVKEIEE